MAGGIADACRRSALAFYLASFVSSLNRTIHTPRPVAIWLPGGVLVITGLTLMLSVAPPFRSVPGRDSGVFLYVASLVLDGRLPYRDVWDHKPPAIYYLDALGLAIGGRSTWGVWAIQTLFICSAILLGFGLMRKALGRAPALFGSVAWLGTFGLLLIWDNYPEEYALPLQFGSLYLFCQVEHEQAGRPPHSLWPGILNRLLIGALGALCFLLKPTLVGTQLAIVAVIIVFRRRCSAPGTRHNYLGGYLAAICAGALLVLVPVTAYFWANGALDQALDAVFRYGIAYSAAPVGDRLLSILSGLGGLPALSGAPALALISWIGICGHTLRHTGKGRRGVPGAAPPPFADPTISSNNVGGADGNDGCDERNGRELLSSVALVGLPIELLLVAVSGRTYGYYYTAWLPMLGILCGLFAHNLLSGTTACSDRSGWVRVVCLCALLPVMIGVPAAVVSARMGIATSTAMTRVEAVRYLSAHTSADNQVLIWGAEPGVNFSAGRRSPTRFVYQYPLYTRGYTSASLVRELLNEIKHNKPALIIDASASDRITPPLDAYSRERWTPRLVYDLPPEMQAVFDYLGSQYDLVGNLGEDGWRVYARKLSHSAIVP